MGKAIGIFACTTLVGATLWMAGSGERTPKITAGENDSAAGPAQKRREARDLFQDGRAAYVRGRYAEAIRTLEASRGAKGPLTVAEKRERDNLLRQAGLEVARASANPAQASLLDSDWQSADGDEAAAKPSRDSSDGFEQAGPFVDPVAKPSKPRATTARKPATIPANASPAKKQAMLLLQEAHELMDAGKWEAARTRAMQAKQLKAYFTLYEESPDQVLTLIERQTGSQRFGRKGETASAKSEDGDIQLAGGEQPESESPAPRATHNARKAQADQLLTDARKLMQSGNYSAARAKAQQAEKLEVAYKQFDERPELVLEDLDRLERQGGSIAGTAPRGTSPRATKPRSTGRANHDAMKKQAESLLAESQKDLKAGRLEDAREKAEKAASMDVAWDVLDYAPDTVLAQIAAVERKSGRMIAANPETETGDEESTTKPRSRATPTEMAAKKARVISLLRQAKAELADGNVAEARSLADEASQYEVYYSASEESPDMVLADIDRAERNSAVSPGSEARIVSGTGRKPMMPRGYGDESEIARTGSKGPKRTPTIPAEVEDPSEAASGDPVNALAENVGVIHPGGASAQDHYNRGLGQLRSGNRDAAYQSFLAAHQSGQRLEPHRQQQLQDFLRDLAPRKNRIRLAQNEVASDKGDGDNPEPSKIDIAAQQQSAQYERLRSETLNTIFRAERMREKNPDEALEMIDRAMTNIESSGLSEKSVGPLAKQLKTARASVEADRKLRAPIIENEKRNKEVKQAVADDLNTQLRIDQELANLVDEYNKMFKQRRYAEAEVLAKQAKDIAPENPVSEVLYQKAKFARRIDSNDKLRDEKENSYWEQLNAVEDATINRVAKDNHPIDFGDPKEWAEMSKRRGKYGRPDNRNRTEEEIRIEKSLTRPISLHFEKAPLHDVIKQVATAADVNVVLDTRGLEEEGASTDTPVSIDVDGIMLKSALNLLLEPLHLSYTIEDEVLKITSRMRQQGKLVVTTYPVADLVVPIPNFSPAGGVGMSGSGSGNNTWGGAAGQFNVGMGGRQQKSAGAQFQVNDPVAGAPGAVGSWNGSPNITAGVAGGGSNVDFDTIQDLIVSTVEPDSWDEVGGPGSVRPFETTLSLVIRQTQKVHEEIADLLEQLRRLQDLQVTIEVRFITVSERFFERIGVDFDWNVQDNLNADTATLGGFGFPTGVQAQAQNQQQQQQQQQQQAQAQQQAGGVGAGVFTPQNSQSPTLDNWPRNGTIVGLGQNIGDDGTVNFTPDYDVSFRQGSFEVGVPDFGGFLPTSGIQVGLGILTDIEAFFFIQAAQGDSRSNILFAPKVTLFNGQQASVQNTLQRPFVTSLIPTVGFFAVGFTPQITVLSEGVTMQVQAVISADRRYVRLTVIPSFTNINDVFTFTFQGGPGAAGQQGGQQGLGQQAVSGNQPFSGGNQGGAGQPFSVSDRTAEQAFFGVPDGLGATAAFTSGPAVKSMLWEMAPNQNIQQQGQVQQGQQQQGNQQQQQQGVTGGFGTTTIQQPVFNVVNVTTTVSVPDGGTVLLGGIKTLRESRNMDGVPILNKIPYVSRLFKNTGVGRETESLMMMVTPRIIIQEEEEELLGIPL